MATGLNDMPYPGVTNYTQYAMARLGLLPLPNVEPLRPDFGVVINDVLSFRYRLTIPRCKYLVTKRNVFIAVISAPENFEKRKMIRQTWKNDLTSKNEKGCIALAGFAFILGLTENNMTQSKIQAESRANGDIIQIMMSDFYRNLTLKVAGLFNWLYRNCSNPHFVLKVDDDVYVNVRNLAYFLKFYKKSNYSMFGSAAENDFATNRRN